ncbi:hypothetical protein ABPG72_001350 [Tetrahymena utriculariae]
MNKKIVFLLSAYLLIAIIKADTCTDGYYDNGSSKCIQCPQYCSKCTDANTCTECQASNFSYKGICVSQCPSQSKASGTASSECEQLCKNDGEYPEYEKEVFSCKAVANDSSAYCIQQLQYLQTDKIGFSFQISNPTDDVNLNLKVLFFNTPAKCYTFDLHLGTDPISPLSTKNINGALEILYQYPIKKMDKDTTNDCSNEKCTFTKKLFWKGMLQYTYRFEVKIQNYASILNDGIQITGSGSNTSPICVGCVIPKELKLKAQLQISCDKTDKCQENDTSPIKAIAGETVTVTQILEDNYKQNTIQPFSLSLMISDDSGANFGSFEIKNYSSDSTTKGQITYKFSTIGFKSGTLVVASKIDNVIFSGRRQLASNLRSLEKIEGTKYPYQEIKVEIQTDSISSSAAIGLIVGIVVACVAAVMSFFVLIVYMYKRRKIQRLQEKVNVSNQVNEESIQHMNNMQNGKQLQQQNQIQNQVTDNKSAIFIQN